MPRRRVKMTCVTLGFAVLLFATALKRVNSIQCYVCGDSNNYSNVHQQQNGSSRLSCDDFDKSVGEALAKFIVDCPEQYQGCITQKQGSDILRACDTVAFDDCQSANGITYCYCSGNLCNAPGAMKLSTTSAVYIDLNKVADLTDDEDYVEMSGDGHFDDFDPNEKTLVIKGNFDTERAKALLDAVEEEQPSPPIPHNDGIDDGHDFITIEDDYVRPIVNDTALNATEPDTTSSTWSTVISKLADVTSESNVTAEDTTTTTSSSTVWTTHIADIRKTSTRLLGSNSSCRLLLSGQLIKLIILLAWILTSL